MSQRKKPGLTADRVLPLFALTFVDVLGLTLILPLLHLYAAAFGASPVQIGFAAAAFPLAQLVGVPIMGALSDRFGRKPLLVISQVTTCLSFIMLATATSLEMVILSRLFDGLFGANLATAQAAVTDLTDQSNRARGLGLTGAAFGLGFLFGPAIAYGTLELTGDLAMPAAVAAIYSAISVLLTLFTFRETLPPADRTARPAFAVIFTAARMLRRPQVSGWLCLLFAEQIAFFAFESLLGLFVLTRLGLLGQGTSLLFIFVGLVLVFVQTRLIKRFVARYGERRVVTIALACLAIGLLLTALTPEQPHPLYNRRLASLALLDLAPTSTEAVIGAIPFELPDDNARGFGGILWFLIAITPIAIGAGLLRPSVNSLITQSVPASDIGGALGVSASTVSLANAVAPIAGGVIFQGVGVAAPFGFGAGIMAMLCVLTLLANRRSRSRS